MNPTPLQTGEYEYHDAGAGHTAAYLWPTVFRRLEAHFGSNGHGSSRERRVFELGCGNGALAAALCERGYQVAGVDPSESGIEQARLAHPEASLHVGGCYNPLAEVYGRFPAVVSLEVVEHVYAPREFARCVRDLLEPGGIAIISTPYHSYLKNLALALAGKMDAHFGPLWDHGHIKFWSVETLTELFHEQGMTRERIDRVGRIPALAKSMILTFRAP
jgi:2-polyprenyl-3-methyl-5-hydroxy-6-metoxy-1,4-benzoquinol methylase